MKSTKTPPHIIIKSTKEVIFYLSKDNDSNKDIKLWMEDLNLTDYKGMTINSKCIFNRLKDQKCNQIIVIRMLRKSNSQKNTKKTW